MKPTVYLETTIIGYLAMSCRPQPEPNDQILAAATR